jgi:predicted DNA-binding antitoxin AbrB/MazE fold protein
MKKNGVVKSTNLIALADEVNLSPGTRVEVEIRVLKPKSKIDRSVFGMWKDRKDMQESQQWVARLRNGEKWGTGYSTSDFGKESRQF